MKTKKGGRRGRRRGRGGGGGEEGGKGGGEEEEDKKIQKSYISMYVCMSVPQPNGMYSGGTRLVNI